MDESLKQEMLVWAQLQLDTMPPGEFGGDWWGAFNNYWDVNIWDSAELGIIATYEEPIRVTAYPMTKDGSTNFLEFVSIGFINEREKK